MLTSALPPDSPLMVAHTKGDSLWGLDTQLLAWTVDLLAGANWQRSGGRGAKPKPVRRPGTKDNEQVFGSGRTRVELDALLATHVGARRPQGGANGDQPG